MELTSGEIARRYRYIVVDVDISAREDPLFNSYVLYIRKTAATTIFTAIRCAIKNLEVVTTDAPAWFVTANGAKIFIQNRKNGIYA